MAQTGLADAKRPGRMPGGFPGRSPAYAGPCRHAGQQICGYGFQRWRPARQACRRQGRRQGAARRSGQNGQDRSPGRADMPATSPRAGAASVDAHGGAGESEHEMNLSCDKVSEKCNSLTCLLALLRHLSALCGLGKRSNNCSIFYLKSRCLSCK